MATITKDQVMEALSTCYDPEMPGVSIIDLGLVYNVEVDDNNNVDVKMTLTTPGCGMGASIQADATAKIESVEGVEKAVVEIIWEPPWTTEMITDEGRQKMGYS